MYTELMALLEGPFADIRDRATGMDPYGSRSGRIQARIAALLRGERNERTTVIIDEYACDEKLSKPHVIIEHSSNQLVHKMEYENGNESFETLLKMP